MSVVTIDDRLPDIVKEAVEREIEKLADQAIEEMKVKLRDRMAHIVMSVHSFYECKMDGRNLVITVKLPSNGSAP